MLPAMRRFLFGLLGVAGVLVALPVALAGAVPKSAIPPDLARLTAAWAALRPTQLVITVSGVNTVRGKPVRGTAVLAVRNSPVEEQLSTMAGGEAAVLRSFNHFTYLSVPGLASIDGGHRWVRASNAEVESSRVVDLAGGLQSLMASRLKAAVARAASVQEVGPVSFGGQPATEFVVVTGPVKLGPITTHLWFAGDGQLVHALIGVGTDLLTVNISTTTPVHIRHPPAAATVGLDDLSLRQRAKVKSQLGVVTFGLGLTIGAVFEEI